ncbi:MAG: amidohydrolase family protein [Spirochaetes bacterium]|nr:amidohydrolase family protein [Spirochaetota bacterium]
MVIDAHAHLQSGCTDLDDIVESGLIESIWVMDLSDAHITYAPFASEAEVLTAAKRYPGFVVPFGYLDLNNGSPDSIDALRDKGFIGLKPYKPAKPYDHHDHFPLYERAAALGMPILFHTGIVSYGMPGEQNASLGHGCGTMRPSMLASIAEAFPELTIIGGHLGYPWLDETEMNLYYYKNIYHDLSGYRKDIEWFIRILDRKCHDGTKRYFNDKILFATDAMYGTPESNAAALRLVQYWQLFLEMIGGLYYRWGEPGERNKILRGNAEQLRSTFTR